MRTSSILPAFRPLHRHVHASTLPTPSPCVRLSPPTTQTSSFSTTSTLQARKQGKPKKDARITQIRYHLSHPLTPRPLRFSRLRSLRHWTIHRAWQLFRARQRQQQELELERQYNAMRAACEALRLIGGNGMPGGPGGPNVGGRDVGRLFRVAMEKKGVFGNRGGDGGGVPIEHARIQTEFPRREGWDHGWTR